MSYTLITADALAHRVRTLGRDLRDRHGPDDELRIIGVLNGSFVFMADLVRAIPGPVRCDFVGARSYEGTTSTGTVTLTRDWPDDLRGQSIVIVEDIVDTGRTLAFLRESLARHEPGRVCIVALLDKPSRREVPVEVDLVGFTIEDRFVVGYGLDFDGLYRNLPYLACLDGTDR